MSLKSLRYRVRREYVPVREGKRWTQDEIVNAIQLWANQHGGQPPKYVDWTPSRGAVKESVCIGLWPTGRQVTRAFGSWNAAIQAAGLVARNPWRPRKEA